jgi:hypothetical protein
VTAATPLPTADIQVPAADIQVPGADIQVPGADIQVPTADIQVLTADAPQQVAPAPDKGAKAGPAIAAIDFEPRSWSTLACTREAVRSPLWSRTPTSLVPRSIERIRRTR